MAERRPDGEPRVALDRLAFLTAFVPYLVAQDGPVTVAEAAAHFGYPEEYVRRSAEQLTLMGVPGESGYHGMANDLFDIDWDALEQHDELVLTNRVAIDDVPRLSAREAAAIIAGLEILGQDPGVARSADFSSLRGKLVSSAAAAPEAPAVGGVNVPGLAELSGAIAAGRQVRFRYRSSGAAAAEERTVDPLRIEAIDASYHLRGWCHLRDAFRIFRLDRIDDLELLASPVTHDARELDEATSGFTPGEGATTVTIRFDAVGAELVEGYRPESLEVDRASGMATMTVVLSAFAVVRRILAEVPGARVVGPPDVVEAVRSWAADAVNRYVTRHG